MFRISYYGCSLVNTEINTLQWRMSNQVILEEEYDENYEPTEEG